MERLYIAALDKIVGRLEAFQNRRGAENDSQQIKDELRTAKDALLRALNAAENGSRY